MKKSDSSVQSPLPVVGTADSPLHRSGAVARMVRMPVATWRVWQRRLSSRAATVPQRAADLPTPGAEPVPPRRWDDVALADFATRSPTIACERPRHGAGLMTQRSHFEAYSAVCEHRKTADAEWHAHLRRVATALRPGFQAALEPVALHEGRLLPVSVTSDAAAVAPNAQHAQTITAEGPRRST